jgi:hypothetical protein
MRDDPIAVPEYHVSGDSSRLFAPRTAFSAKGEPTMPVLKSHLNFAVCAVALLLIPAIAMAQSQETQQRIAALKQFVAQDRQNLRQYEWVETTIISLKGEAGNVSVDMPGGGHGARLNFKNYSKPGDLLSVEVDPASNRVMGLTVATYLDDAKDAVTLDVRFMSLQDGTGYPAAGVLEAKAKNLMVNISNSGYRKMNQ